MKQQFLTDLYSKNKDGSFNTWRIFVEGGTFTVEFGKEGGAIQEKTTTCMPTNVGRSNERSAEEQALFEAEAKYKDQMRKGYRETKVDDVIISPMLAKDASKVPHLIKYPCHVGSKLDGLRLLVTFDSDGKPQFNSRGNKTYPIKGDIVAQIKKLHELTDYPMFDGELYIHGLPLQDIVSLAKKWRTHVDIQKEIDADYAADLKRRDKAILKGEVTYKTWNKQVVTVDSAPVRDDNRYSGYESADLEYHIFDIPSDLVWDSNVNNFALFNYEEHPCRYADLNEVDRWIDAAQLEKLKVVCTSIADNEEKIKISIGHFMEKGFEGTIIRNFDGLYEFNQRSSDMLKWKLFQDTELLIIGMEEDKNQEAVLHGKSKTGIITKFKMKGSHSTRTIEASKPLLNKFVNVRFQAYTVDGNLQFPVGVCVRECDPVTWEPLD